MPIDENKYAIIGDIVIGICNILYYGIWFLYVVHDGEDTKKKKIPENLFLLSADFFVAISKEPSSRGRNSYNIIYTNSLGSPFAVVVVVVVL